MAAIRFLWVACGLAIAPLFIGEVTAEPAKSLTVEQLLAVPDLQSYVTNRAGDVAWVERAGATTTIFVARAPTYTTEKLLAYEEDDGLPVKLIGFDAKKNVIYIRGRKGYNPSHARLPVVPGLFSIIEGKSEPTSLIRDVSSGFAGATISSDEQALYYAAGGAVYLLDISKHRVRTSELFSVRGRVTDLKSSPDGKKLAFVSNRSGYKRGKYSYAGVFDLETQTVNYMEAGLGMDQDLTWSPDSQNLAFVRFGYEPRTWRFSDHRQGAPFDVMVVDADTGRGEAVFTSETGYGSRFNGFFSSGYSGLGGKGSLLWLSDDRLVFPYEKTGWKHLYAVSASGGDIEQLTAGEFEVAIADLSADRSTVYFLANSEDDLARLSLYTLDVAPGALPKKVSLGSDKEMPWSFRVMPSGGFAYAIAGPKTPTRLMVAPNSTDERQVSTGPGLGDPIADLFPTPEVVEFEASDGLRIQTILYRPKNVSNDKKYPVLVHSHGGPRTQARPVLDPGFSYQHILPYFAEKGYFVFSVNFRSGTGFGLDFREPDSYGGRGAGDVQDFIDAAHYIKETYPEIDPDRMAIYGHSYGGHNVTNALARSDVYVAGVSSAGVGDWVIEMEKDFGEALQYNIPERVELEELAHNSSAISQVDKWGNEPLLLLHGDNDGSAAMQQSLELYHALRRRGIEAEAVIFPGEDHGYQRYETRLRFMEAMEAFLTKHLGGPSAQ